MKFSPHFVLEWMVFNLQNITHSLLTFRVNSEPLPSPRQMAFDEVKYKGVLRLHNRILGGVL